MGLREETKPFEGLAAAARTATVNGSGADLWGVAGRAREVIAVLSSAAGTGTTPTLDVKLQESDDNSSFTDIAAANIAGGAQFAQVTTVASFQERIYRPQKRYVRAVATIGGTTPSFTCAVILFAGDPLEGNI